MRRQRHTNAHERTGTQIHTHGASYTIVIALWFNALTTQPIYIAKETAITVWSYSRPRAPHPILPPSKSSL